MAIDLETLKAQLNEQVPGSQGIWSTFQDQVRVQVQQSSAFESLKWLKEKAGFDMLVDVTAVDYLEYEGATDRFELVYCLLNVDAGDRLVVLVHLNEPDLKVQSATPLWSGANWMEREVYDMYGIEFVGHPNFKRLLLPDEFTSFPLRKDYPVKGRGERHNFPIITRSES